MLDRGVALAPGPYEVAFPSMAHGAADYDLALAVRRRRRGRRRSAP